MKFQEAEFFLGKLDEHNYDDVRKRLKATGKSQVFLYYLSAFLSAARSVTWIMRNEYGKAPGWEQWFKTKMPDEENIQLLRLFNQLRVQSEKIHPIVPGRTFRIEGDAGPPVERDPRLPHFKITITSGDPESDGQPLI